ncbi:hypothetical protein PR003_g15970 [Phytophthora rubi]|uniref:Reverse transcriptase Ty1/copia-type domain-containing protein n=1 Tax=Phytophthora rubi TaxID=129364 RepID=A0A6A4EU79_9STRA|nr:hypothetical protein PR002_g15643 [Phytophthora rubi]KAE9028078.1 hypothetical protein PR001_g11816 [Phytophthora rubi]KAE9327633.1 hypothetical protein PR003_g15970 [Phytophthora rubi]
MATISTVKDKIRHSFKLKDLGAVRYILGIEVHHDLTEKTFMLHQPRYIDDLVQSFNQTEAHPSVTPIDLSLPVTKEDQPETQEDMKIMRGKPFRSIIGCLSYLTGSTRPDIAVAVSRLSRYLENPGIRH